MPDLSLRRERRRRPPVSWVEKGPHPMAARVKEDIVCRQRARSRVSSPGGSHVGGPVPGGVRGGRPVPPADYYISLDLSRSLVLGFCS